MQLHEWGELLVRQVLDTDWLQWVAVAAGVAEVLFARSGKIWLYPTGILGTALTIYILYQTGLYAECLLNGYYVVMSVYGWWYWAKKKDLPLIRPTYSTTLEWRITGTIVGAGTLLLYLFLKYGTPSTVPFWDALVSATAWAGMWLLARRKIENWILLNISNVIAVPLLLYKQLPLFAALTVFLFIIAIQGYVAWRREIRSDMSIE